MKTVAPSDFALTRRQRLQAIAQERSFGEALSTDVVPLQSSLNSIQQILIAEGFREELDSSGFHSSHRHRDIAVSSDENDGNVIFGLKQLALQVQAAHSR